MRAKLKNVLKSLSTMRPLLCDVKRCKKLFFDRLHSATDSVMSLTGYCLIYAHCLCYYFNFNAPLSTREKSVISGAKFIRLSYCLFFFQPHSLVTSLDTGATAACAIFLRPFTAVIFSFYVKRCIIKSGNQ